MAERAHSTSVEVLVSFRASLIVYLTKARPALEDVSDDVMRTRVWLQNDQRVHWENQMRRRSKLLEMAQQELSAARMGGMREASSAHQAAVYKAKRAVDEAEEKLRRVKQWGREFDNRVEPMVRQLDKLASFLTSEMPKATFYLAQAIKSLDAYAGVATPMMADAPAKPSEAKAEDGAAAAGDAAGAAPAGESGASQNQGGGL